jgi:hypothetical protein
MKSNRLVIFAVLLFFVACISCNHGQPNAGNAGKHDSVSAPIKKDSLSFSASYLEFSGKFKKDREGRVDPDDSIPFSLVNSFLSEKLDTLFNNSIQPMDYIQNRYGNFFIIQVNCVAGGDCATYHLIVFDKAGKFVKTSELGSLSADEDETVYFTYEQLSDTTLRGWRMVTGGSKTSDSTSWIISLK